MVVPDLNFTPPVDEEDEVMQEQGLQDEQAPHDEQVMQEYGATGMMK